MDYCTQATIKENLIRHLKVALALVESMDSTLITIEHEQAAYNLKNFIKTGAEQ